ncbi:MAG: response regulator [Bacteriovorax sp.]|jgi:DNA-binding response OmpR family regulator
MASKVLVADDSLTIQKVIGITLANSGYELVESLNEADLLKRIQTVQFDLVLLDFNLSDSRTGYELAKQINQAMPNAAIVIMLGTFDTVDESQFAECGIADKIVKPFESTKFIKKCRDLLEGARPQFSVPKMEKAEEPVYSKADDLDSWKVDAPQVQSYDSIEEEDVSEIKDSSATTMDPLSSEIEGWGFTPQNAIEEKFQKVFPPVIEESTDANILDRLQTSSQFVLSNENDEDNDETDPSFEIPEDLNRKLLNEIEEDVSAEAFWAVDEVVPKRSEEEEYIGETNLDEITADLTETVQAFKDKEWKPELSLDSNVESGQDMPKASSMDQDALVEKLKIAMRPMIEEMVKEFCRQSAEKVAWEVIPDLAENLIRKEIKEISDSVQH